VEVVLRVDTEVLQIHNAIEIEIDARRRGGRHVALHEYRKVDKVNTEIAIEVRAAHLDRQTRYLRALWPFRENLPLPDNDESVVTTAGANCAADRSLPHCIRHTIGIDGVRTLAEGDTVVAANQPEVLKGKISDREPASGYDRDIDRCSGST